MNRLSDDWPRLRYYMYMVAIGMPRGFEWLFLLALLVPLSLGVIVAFFVVRSRRAGRGFPVTPKPPDGGTSSR